MRRFSLLFVVLAILAAGCTSSTTVLGDQSTELASVDPAGPLAEPTIDPLDNSWLDTAPPLATATPVPAVPAPVVEPAAAPADDASDEAPTVEAPSDDANADANEAEAEPVAPPEPLSFDTMVADSVEALNTAAVVQIVLERSVGPGEQNDYSSTSGIVIDRVADLQRALVVLNGAGWTGLATRNNLTRLNTDDRYEFLFGSDDIYVSAQPRLAALPSGTSWLQQQTAEMSRVQLEQFNTTVVTSPSDVLAEVTALLGLVIEPRRISDETFELSVPNSRLLRIAPGSSILSLVALDHVANENIVASRFTKKSPVRLRFKDGLLVEVHVDLSGIFAELPDLGGTDGFEGIEISETYRLSFGTEALLTLPDAADTADPTNFYPVRDTVGDCFTLNPSIQFVQVPCAEPHSWEIIETGNYGDAFGAALPDSDTLLGRTGPVCNVKAEDLLDIELEQTDLIVDVKTPDKESWDAGDRQWACWLSFSQEVEGPVRSLDLSPFFGKVKRFSLEAGQCLRDEGLGQAYFTVIDCAEPHYYEVYLRYAVTTESGGFPGREAVLEEADTRCVQFVEARVTNDDLQLEWQVHALVPNDVTWDEFNDRSVMCLATTEEQVTGRRFG